MKKSMLWILMLVIVSKGFGNLEIQLDNAIGVYRTNREASLELIQIIQRDTPLDKIRTYFYGKLAYELYYDYIHSLPRTPMIDIERLNTTFLTGNPTNLIADIQNYLEANDAMQFVRAFGVQIADSNISRFLGQYLTNDILFVILKESLLQTRRFLDMDRILLGDFATNYQMSLSQSNIIDYLSRSFLYYRRDIIPIARLHRLEADTNTVRLIAVSYYIQKNYTSFIQLIERFPSLSTEDKLNQTYQIDMPYFLADSYFRTGDYPKSLQWIEKTYFPWFVDIAEHRFLCYLAQNERPKALQNLSMVRDSDSRIFYNILLAVLDNPTNSAESIENYIQTKNIVRKFNLEALLLAYTYHRNKENLIAVAEIIKNEFIKRGSSSFSANLLSLAYGYFKEIMTEPPTEGSRIADFYRYQMALSTLATDREKAKSLLLNLIKEPKTSPLIKSLSIYEYRKW